MTQSDVRTEVPELPLADGFAQEPKRRGRGPLAGLGVDRFSGLYLMLLLIVVYSLLKPDTFFTVNNFRIILASQAITGILTLGLMISLICGIFDLSVAANMSFSILFVGWLQSAHGVNWVLAVILTVLVGALIGVINAVVVTKMHVDAVIGTLGVSSVLAAATYWLTNGQSVTTGIDQQFTDLGNAKWLTVPAPAYMFAIVAVVLWYLLNHTPTGRYLYAVGSNATASRLAGLKVLRLQWFGLIVSAVLASFAGVVFTAQLGTSSFDAGAPFLLPAFSAAFLGATQIRPGRFNVVGTVISIYLLAVGIKGLELLYPGRPWLNDLFEGLVLIVAVGLAARSARRRAKNA
ncbi:ABC transporter permease [Nocardioides sp. BP30]|uniref:ABC transporter permease n=1 Tax=Nocardioides sp. BP30 TaxID=3036374 RepID=UPI002468803D|nr:ABC transporter permease [Nocardioides sp. BP30]WGL54152.1 ABC transporter permease [Nocardioides sp. BP30]